MNTYLPISSFLNSYNLKLAKSIYSSQNSSWNNLLNFDFSSSQKKKGKTNSFSIFRVNLFFGLDTFFVYLLLPMIGTTTMSTNQGNGSQLRKFSEISLELWSEVVMPTLFFNFLNESFSTLSHSCQPILIGIMSPKYVFLRNIHSRKIYGICHFQFERRTKMSFWIFKKD